MVFPSSSFFPFLLCSQGRRQVCVDVGFDVGGFFGLIFKVHLYKSQNIRKLVSISNKNVDIVCILDGV